MMDTPDNEYPCPECGFEGPHTVYPAEDDSEPTVAECGDGDCGVEFTIREASSR